MKKKTTAKARRDEQNASRTLMIQEIIARNERKAEDKAGEEIQRLESDKHNDNYRDAILEIKNKLQSAGLEPVAELRRSGAKVAGLKSAFVLSDSHMLLTTFGRGNESKPEIIINGDQVHYLTGNSTLNVEHTEKNMLTVSGKDHRGVMFENPINKSKHQPNDLIDLRKQLEEKYFGEQFQDNIHIQIVYNILDIEKIIGVHFNHAVHSVSSMLGGNTDADDFIGSMGLDDSFEKFQTDSSSRTTRVRKQLNCLMSSPKICYFGDLFGGADNRINAYKKINDEKSRNNCRKTSLRNSYYYLSLLGMIRQSLTHGNSIDRLYTLDEKTHGKYAEAKEALDVLYSSRIEKINSNFISRAQKDLGLLLYALKADTPEKKRKLVQDYYKFIILKQYKNQGISYKRLRNYIIASYCDNLLDKKWDDYRSKINRYIDFLIYQYYQSYFNSGRQCDTDFSTTGQCNTDISSTKKYEANPSSMDQFVNTLDLYMTESKKKKVNVRGASSVWQTILPPQTNAADLFVEKLRSCKTENEKLELYVGEASRIWQDINQTLTEEIIDNIVPAIRGGKYIDRKVDWSMIKDVLLTDQASYFSKLMYMLTCFLDGKETNSLLTSLIGKFENIAGFLEVLKCQNISHQFSKQFLMFQNSRRIANELRILNNFAHLPEEKERNRTTYSQYCDAALILGKASDKEDLEQEVNHMLESAHNMNSSCSGFKNFISRNVVDTPMFKYIARYSKPETAGRIAKNRRILEFVISQIPDRQIHIYYGDCISSSQTEISPFDERRQLVDLLFSVTFMSFSNIRKQEQGKELSREEMKDIMKKRMTIKLYLFVIYSLLKNLVNVNSRYVLAFHCVERDAANADPAKFTPEFIKKDYACFARSFFKSHPSNKRSRKYLCDNLNNSVPWALRTFRNSVAHLGGIQSIDRYIGKIGHFNTYFELYHYIMQRYLADQFTKYAKLDDYNNPAMKHMLSCFDSVKKYRTYSKDLVKILCVHFSYNLPRYKNLSVECLFDRYSTGGPAKNDVLQLDFLDQNLQAQISGESTLRNT